MRGLVLLCLGYLVVGVSTVATALPHVWKRAYELMDQQGHPRGSIRRKTGARREVEFRTLGVLLLWPGFWLLSAWRAVLDVLSKGLEAADPEAEIFAIERGQRWLSGERRSDV